MSGYYYRKSEPGLWTAGHMDGGRFEPESDHESEEAAARRVHFLNGGSAPSASNEQLALGIMAAILKADPQCNTVFDAVTMAREIMDTIYKTETE